MKKIIAILLLSMFCILTGCNAAEECPAIVFLVRTDISDLLSPEEKEQQEIAVYSLGFYDRDGSYYTSTDPELNAMDNQTLIAEYEAGHLTEQIQYHKSCDTAALAKQYNKLLKIYRHEKFEVIYPEALPAVEAESTIWYGFYYDKDGSVQYQPIHRRERLTDMYTDNDTVNEVYDWIIGAFRNNEE